jgi:nucleolar pre-ribosomal-associated protein 1
MVSKGRLKSEFIGSEKVTMKIGSFPVLSCSDATDASLVDEVHREMKCRSRGGHL